LKLKQSVVIALHSKSTGSPTVELHRSLMHFFLLVNENNLMSLKSKLTNLYIDSMSFH